MMGNQSMNNELKQQLIDTYFIIEQALQLESKPITYLLKEYGEVGDLLKQRRDQMLKEMAVNVQRIDSINDRGSPVRRQTRNRSPIVRNKSQEVEEQVEFQSDEERNLVLHSEIPGNENNREFSLLNVESNREYTAR